MQSDPDAKAQVRRAEGVVPNPQALSGNGFKTISENMRHSTIAITADLYTHIDPETHRQAAERLDAYLSPFMTR